MRTGIAKAKRLTRHFLGTLWYDDLIAPGEDLHGTFAGILALLLMLSAGVSLMFIAKYNSVTLGPRPGFLPVRLQTVAEKLAMALDDEALLLAGVMVVMAILTVLSWNSLTLDERDEAVFGPLPISPTLVRSCKAMAVAASAAVVAVALNLLPALFFPVVVLAKTPVGAAEVLRWMGAHAVAGLAGCAFTFLALFALRSVVAAVLPSRLAGRVLVMAQFALVLGLISLLFSLPVLATRTRTAFEGPWPGVFSLPPLWFVGLEEVLAGRGGAVPAALSRFALFGLVGAVTAALTAELAGLLPRRNPAQAAGGLRLGRRASGAVRRLAETIVEDGRARAGFLFAARTLTRSRRHRFHLAGALGLGLAVAGATVLGAGHGLALRGQSPALTTALLAAQLNLIFFLVLGIRLSASVPADVEAGWPFRFHLSASGKRQLAGARGGIFVLIVLPLLVALLPLHALAWGWYAALVHLAFGVAASLLLLEVVFANVRGIPFVSSFSPGRTLLSLRLPVYVLGYVFFVYLIPVAEWLLIERAGMFYAWLALFGVVMARLIAAQSSGFRHDQVPVFEDGPSRDVQELGLADATGASALDVGSADAPTPRRIERDAGRRGWPRIRRPRVAGGVVGLAERLRADLFHASRGLLARPGFTVFSIATLALGVGVTTSIYSIVYSSVLRPLDVAGLDRLVNIYHSDPFSQGSRPTIGLSLADFEDLRGAQTVFSGIAAHAPFFQVGVIAGVGEKIRGELVSGDYFSVLRIRPIAGRLLIPADDGPKMPAVIGERLWQSRFGRRPDVVGSTLTMAGHAFVVVGVAPAAFRGVELPNLSPTTVWVPLSAADLVGAGYIREGRESRWLVAKGRLAPGRTIDDAQAEVRVIGGRLDRTEPLGRDLPAIVRTREATSRPWTVVPASERLVTEQSDGKMRLLGRLTMLAVMLVLLVVCSNLANLMLAQGFSRSREFTIRLALGATRWQIVRQQLVEAGIVAFAGGLGALALARLAMIYGVAATLRLGPWVSLDIAPRLDGAAVAVALVSTCLALVIFGLVPALHLARTTSRSSTGWTSSEAGASNWRGRRLLIASQVAVSVTLVAVASLAVRHMAQVSSRDTGLDLDRLAVVRFDFASLGWSEARARQALDTIAATAGRDRSIEAVTIASGLPVGSAGRLGASLATPDRPFAEPGYAGQRVTLLAATPPVFRTFGVRIMEGRRIDERDVEGADPVVVLSKVAAQSLFGSRSAVGRQVLGHRPRSEATASKVETLTVVGIASDTDSGEVGQRTQGVAYVPFAQRYDSSAAVIARATGDARPAMTAVAGVTRRLYPDLGIIESGTGDEMGGTENVAFRVIGMMAGLLGFVSLALAMIGLYGVLSYLVAQRTHEMGVRLALGARTWQIVRIILADGLRPVAEGLVAGLAAADLVEMITRPAFVTPLPAIDPGVLMVVPLPFLLAAVVACLVPARRAARVAPNVVLKEP